LPRGGVAQLHHLGAELEAAAPSGGQVSTWVVSPSAFAAAAP
jgi:hypothetical protein